jgi:glycosyltransferase involved in cell wall biosynthesis
MPYFFDISTVARWTGHAVGIVRVERELARRAQRLLGPEARFCVFDFRTETFKLLRPEVAARLIDAEAAVNFEPPTPPPPAPQPAPRRPLRDFVMERLPHLYQAIHGVQGRRYSIEEIARLRHLELNPPSPPPPPVDLRIPFDDAIEGDAPLRPGSVFISAGLDWDHKNLRGILRKKEKTGFTYVAVIYDLIPLTMPQFVVPYYVNVLTEYFGELAWTADVGLCISRTTQRDFDAYCAKNRIDRVRTEHFMLGADISDAPADPDELPPELKGKDFALYVSTIEPRKNHRMLYEAWCHGLETGAIDPERHRLVFVGREGWEVGPLLSELRRNPLTRRTVLILSNVSDETLTSLYAGAAFTLFPSFYEGFGLPLAEALAHGKLCLTSGAGALSEIGEGLRIDLPPRDTVAWSRQMAALLHDPALRASWERRIGKGFRPVNWDESAQQFFAHVRKLAPAS